MIEVLESFNPDLFHFLRPEWLWAFVPLALVVIFIFLSNRDKFKWKEKIASHLRAFVFDPGKKSSLILPTVSYTLALAFAILAMAGPTWKMKEVPGAKATARLVIMLDVSQSMMTKDIQPNRLERAKLKIIDLLESDPKAPISLWAFSGTTHPIIPATTDYSLIQYNLEAIKPYIMPVQGRNFPLMMEMVDTIFSTVEAPSTLLLLTDEIRNEDIATLNAFVEETPHRIEIMLMSSQTGGEVPGYRPGTKMKDSQGRVVFSKADFSLLSNVDQAKKIHVNYLTLDKSDVEKIAKDVGKNLVFQKDDLTKDDEWEDRGELLFLPIFIFLIPFFRKGWMIQWCIILFVTPLFFSCDVEEEGADYWYTKDYQGQHYYDDGDYEKAAETYESVPHKGVAYYKSGDYEAALTMFEMDSSTSGKYNQAITLVKLGRLEEAKIKFEEVKEEDPSFASVEENIRQTEFMIMQKDSISQLNNAERAIEKKKGPLKTRSAQSEDEELSSDTEVEELPEEGDRISDEVETSMSQAEELERPPEDMDQGQQKAAANVLLRKAQYNPSEFLRRRFVLQREKIFPNVKQGDEKW